MTRFHYQDRVFAVTGAGSGIGRALALGLKDRGAKLALADINTQALAETKALLGNHPVEITPLDVSDKQAVDHWAATTQAAFGRVDGIINNAGMTLGAPAATGDVADARALMDVNYWGTVYGCQAFLPLLQQQPQSLLINLSSIFGFIGYAGQSAYCASKFAVKGYTETLREELRETGVQVVQVHPGGVKTNIVTNARYMEDQTGRDIHADVATMFARLAPTAPEAAAETILSGAAKDKTRILIGRDARMVDRLHRFFPLSHPTAIRRFFC